MFAQDKMNLGISQRQALTLSPGALQSLEILRLPYIELCELLSQRICENPMLELNEESAAEFPPVPEKAKPAPVADEENSNSDEAGFYTESVWKWLNAGQMPAHEAFDPLARFSSEQTFSDMLHFQLGCLDLPSDFASLCAYIIDDLNRQGYLATAPEEIAEITGRDIFHVMQAIYVVQSFQPAGVGARSLQECLLFQLGQGPNFNQNSIRLIKGGLGLIAKNDINGIMKLLNCSRDKAISMCGIIKSLNPIPSQGYYTGENKAYIQPDARITQEGNNIVIQINRDGMPELIVNKDYEKLLKSTADDETGKYLQKQYNEAQELIKAVGDRESTMAQILKIIAGIQKDYFEDGKSLQPMSMTDIADALNLNVSTISRAVQEKYIDCAAGIVELKSLFSGGIVSQTGVNVSTPVIKQKIAEFINAEDSSSPLSDESIRIALETAQIKISRRTVTKYRKEMGIDASSMRTRY